MARLVQPATTVRNEPKRIVVWIDSAAASVVHVPLNEPGGEEASLAQLPRLLAKRTDNAARGTFGAMPRISIGRFGESSKEPSTF